MFAKEQEMEADELFIYYWLLREDEMADDSCYCYNRYVAVFTSTFYNTN